MGAGLAGASVTWHLAGEHRVRIVEQGPEPGGEASAQNAGMVRRLVADPVERALAVRSTRRLTGDLADREPFEGAFRRVGGVVGERAPSDALAAAALDLRRRGVRVDEVGPDAVAEVAPALTGSPLGAVWHLPDDGLADAHTLVQGFLRDARARGSRVDLGTRATGLRIAGDRVTGVDTPLGGIEAETVVLATGAWSARLAIDLGLGPRLHPLARHLLLSDPHPLATRTHPWCWIDDGGVYARPEGGGWLCSPCDEFPRMPAPGPGSAEPWSEEARARLRARLERDVPALAALRFARGWSGLRTFVRDRRPLLGPDPRVRGLWWATALGGAGVTCAFSAGELVATLLRRETPDWIDPRDVDPGRPAARADLPSGG